MSDPYERMTDREFDAIFESLVEGMSAAEILQYGDVNTILREELNNVVLTIWEEKHPEYFNEGDEDDT